jgi:putative redox protein
MTRDRRAVVTFDGSGTWSATTGTGRTVVFGDDVAANSHSPVEIVATALAACTAMDVASILAKKRQVVESYSVAVDAVQRDEYPQILTRIRLLHEVAGPVVTEAAVRRAIELSGTRYCPVNAMLSAGATAIEHAYRVRGTGAVPFEVEGIVLVTGPFRRPDPVAGPS